MVQILRVTVNHPSTFNSTVDLDWAIQNDQAQKDGKSQALKAALVIT